MAAIFRMAFVSKVTHVRRLRVLGIKQVKDVLDI